MRRDEAVDVEQRHDVEAAVGRRQRQGRSDVAARRSRCCAASAARSWAAPSCRRCAARARRRRRRRRSACRRLFLAVAGQRVGAGLAGELEPRRVGRGRGVGAGSVAGQRDQRLRVEVVLVEAKLVLAVRLVQRRGGRCGCDGEEQDGRRRPVGRDDRHAVAGADAQRVELRREVVDSGGAGRRRSELGRRARSSRCRCLCRRCRALAACQP